jgi:hypothetical protein
MQWAISRPKLGKPHTSIFLHNNTARTFGGVSSRPAGKRVKVPIDRSPLQFEIFPAAGFSPIGQQQDGALPPTLRSAIRVAHICLSAFPSVCSELKHNTASRSKLQLAAIKAKMVALMFDMTREIRARINEPQLPRDPAAEASRSNCDWE